MLLGVPLLAYSNFNSMVTACDHFCGGGNFAIFICVGGVRSLETSFKSRSTLDLMMRTLLYKLPLLYLQYNAANINFRHFLGLRSGLVWGLPCRFYVLTYSKVDMRRDDKKRGVQRLASPRGLNGTSQIVISVLDVTHEPSVKANFHLFITNVLYQ